MVPLEEELLTRKRARKLEKKRKREVASDFGGAIFSNGSASAAKRKKGAVDGKGKKQKDQREGSEKQAKRRPEQPLVVAQTESGGQSASAANGSSQNSDPLPATSRRKKKKKAKNLLSGQDSTADKSAGQVIGTSPAQVGSKEAMRKGRPLVKKLYTEDAFVAALSDSELDAFLSERGITTKNCSLRPILEFKHSGLSDALLHATRTFAAPSPIQAQCLPIALSGRDVVGIAATGSGKTLAFGLPCLRHIEAQRAAGSSLQGRSPQALMLSPTRELAQQIAAVMEDAGRQCGISTLCVYGGVPKQPQAKALKKGVDIVVATPGRLEDLMNDGACQVDQVSYLVLDEADRMLDLGFEPHIRSIATQTRADRQTLMFSATWPSEVQRLAMEYLANPARVVIGSHSLSASHSVSQIVEVIDPALRPKRLLELLHKYHSSRKNRVLVFVLYKKEAGRVESELQRAGWKAASVHGDISQAQRSKAVEEFKSGAKPLLVATDVAARGLDIPDVEVVVNYSFPLTTEDYVHRIGRTGRAGKTGTAHTFFSGATDKARSGELINVLKEAGQPVPPELLKFGVTTKKKESKLYGAHFKDVDLSVKSTKIVFDD